MNLNGNLAGDAVVELSGTEVDIRQLLKEVQGFAYGDMTSVAVSPDGSRLAVAIQAEGYADAGVVALFACESDGSLKLLSTAQVGAQPDMVTFADNGTILTADEGEPREALTGAGVLVQKNVLPSEDFGPEYIAVSGGRAYVSLQEANAIAVLDIAAGRFTGVYLLGFQDYGKTEVDLQRNDKIDLKNYENVRGIRMPDGISRMSISGKTYLLTANEGDSRADWSGLDNESEDTTSPTGEVTLDKKVVWFKANLWDGLTLVYDSGSGFEEVAAEQLPGYFNTSNDKITMDNRSGKKGPSRRAWSPAWWTAGLTRSSRWSALAA